MDDTVFLLVFMVGTFTAIPLAVLLARKIRDYLFRKGYIKKRLRTMGTRAALEAHLFIETNIGLKLDVFQVAMSLVSCGCFVVCWCAASVVQLWL